MVALLIPVLRCFLRSQWTFISRPNSANSQFSRACLLRNASSFMKWRLSANSRNFLRPVLRGSHERYARFQFAQKTVIKLHLIPSDCGHRQRSLVGYLRAPGRIAVTDSDLRFVNTGPESSD